MGTENATLPEYFASGGVGGIFAVVLGHPFDTIKVRLHTMHLLQPTGPPLYTGTFDCFKKILKNDGFYGLYKGMGAPLVVIAPIFAVCFTGYGIGREVFGPPPPEPFLPRHYFLSGALAGVFTTIFAAPGERIKCLLQMQAHHSGEKLYNGPLDCMIKLFKTGGIKSVYRGTIATLMRDVPATGCYFLTYELLKNYCTKDGRVILIHEILLAGGIAGVANWIVACPSDVIKSRHQAAPDGAYPRGVIDITKELLKEQGPMAFFTGLTPMLMRAFIANAACFVGFEVTMTALQSLK